MESYTDFAAVYDELMDTADYEGWCRFLDEMIRTYGVSQPVRGGKEKLKAGRSEGKGTGKDTNKDMGAEAGSSGEETAGEAMEEKLKSERDLVLDLGCGTGTLTQLLYDSGYDMIGVDNSEQMLDIAMQKKERTKSDILYLLQDMRSFELYSTVGTVVSVCDSVNYILKPEELLEVFKLVNNYLYPGGIFIFDFNTDYKYREIIGDSTIAENRDDCSFIWENYYDAETKINEYDLTIFLKTVQGLFKRVEETHFQRGYCLEEMTELVEKSGLKLIKTMDADTLGEVTKTSERIYVIAKENEKKR